MYTIFFFFIFQTFFPPAQKLAFSYRTRVLPPSTLSRHDGSPYLADEKMYEPVNADCWLFTKVSSATYVSVCSADSLNLCPGDCLQLCPGVCKQLCPGECSERWSGDCLQQRPGECLERCPGDCLQLCPGDCKQLCPRDCLQLSSIYFLQFDCRHCVVNWEHCSELFPKNWLEFCPYCSLILFKPSFSFEFGTSVGRTDNLHLSLPLRIARIFSVLILFCWRFKKTSFLCTEAAPGPGPFNWRSNTLLVLWIQYPFSNVSASLARDFWRFA